MRCVELGSMAGQLIWSQVYRGCLGQVDTASQVRVERFYRREDSWRK